MSNVILKFINKVEVIDASSLSSSTFFNQGVKLADGLPFEQICIVGLAEMEISDKVESKNRIFHHSLAAVMPHRFTVGNRKCCFRLTAVDGTQWLLGNADRPYPLVEFSDSYPSESSGKCAVTMSVSWRSLGFYPVL